MDFTKYSCPLCGQNFKDTDDVVVCPDCGTPHHRECWFNNGKCVNTDKHGFSDPDLEIYDNKPDIYLDDEDSSDKAFSDYAGYDDTEATENEDNVNNTDKDSDDNKNNAQSFGYFGNMNFNVNQEKEHTQKVVQEIMDRLNNNSQDEVLIDNHRLSFFAAAIGKNQEYYIPRFMLFEKVKKPTSWNVAGFFVPLAWSLYRKMYKLAALIFAVYMIIFAITAIPLINNKEYISASQACLQEDPQYITKILAYQSGSTDVTLTAKQAQLNEIMEEIDIPTYLTVISYVLTLGTRIAMGVFCTYLYFKKLSKNLTRIKTKAKATVMTDESIKMYLYRKYGTLPFILCAIIGFFEWRIF